jgi:type IV secretory pathway VirB4 component
MATPTQVPQSQTNQPPAKAGGGKSTQNSLLISEIKDGVVIMRDGSLRGVILGSAINFDLMSAQEQDSVEFSYQGFLNSLHFPIQIVIKSQKIDLDPYIEKLKTKRNEQSNELLGLLMDDYIANITALVEEVNIMDKQFYIVVPYIPPLTAAKGSNLITKLQAAFESTPQIVVGEDDFKKYKTELAQRMQLVSSGLTQIGIRAIALNTQELIDLYYSAYNPDVAVNEKLIDASQLQTPVVTKGEGSAPRGPLPGAPL